MYLLLLLSKSAIFSVGFPLLKSICIDDLLSTVIKNEEIKKFQKIYIISGIRLPINVIKHRYFLLFSK